MVVVMLNSAEITTMRATAAAALPDVCTIRRKVSTPDGRGGQTDVWSNLATLVPCRIDPQNIRAAAEQVAAARLSGERRWVVTLPVAQDVEAKDRIVIDGRTMEVDTVVDREAWELTRRTHCLEVL